MARHQLETSKQSAVARRAATTGLLPLELRDFIDRVIVPALVDRFLERGADKNMGGSVADCTREAVVSDIVSFPER